MTFIEPIIDISKWQGKIDFDKMIGAKPLGIYMRCAYKDPYSAASLTDKHVREYYNGLRESGIPLSFYYFYHPHIDGGKQATHFLEVVDSIGDYQLPLAIDIESNLFPERVSRGSVSRNLETCMNIIRENSNILPMIYTRTAFWNPLLGSQSWASNYYLWIAFYSSTTSHPWYKNPNSAYKPAPWDDYFMWQYSADGNMRGKEFGVSSSSIDINRVNANIYEEILGIESVDTSDESIPIDVETGENMGKVTLSRGYHYLNMRNKPGIYGSEIVGMIRKGEVLDVIMKYNDGNDIWLLVLKSDNTVGWSAYRFSGSKYLQHVE